MTSRTLLTALVLALPLAAACRTDDTVTPPDLANNGGLFQRYVSMGNSITAGFQSAGINDSTQRQSYAVLLAAAAGGPFYYPSLNMPGCPGPFVNNVLQTRVGGGGPTTCALRASNTNPYLSNVAVPGALVADVSNNFATPTAANALTTFILGGRNQVQAMQAANPTFVSAWVGNNDVLGALTSLVNPGDTTRITTVANFQARYDSVVTGISATTAKAILIGVARVTAIPYASQGATYWCLKTGLCPGVPAAAFPPTFTVNVNCAPQAAVGTSRGDSVLVPWPVGLAKISAAAGGAATTLDCSVSAEVVTPREFLLMSNAVTAYNAYIASVATAKNWAYFDPNPTLLAARANPLLVAPFPNIPANTATTPVTFGTLFSLDGVHPSGAAHKIIADSLASTINQKYGTSIPLP